MTNLTRLHFNAHQDFIDVTDGNSNGFVDDADRAVAIRDFSSFKKGDVVPFDDKDYAALRLVATPNTTEEQLLDIFNVNVDYDLDVMYNDGCHGTDIFWNDDPLILRFTLLESGAVLIRAVDEWHNINTPTIQLDSDDKLYFRKSNNPHSLIQDPIKITKEGGCGGGSSDLWSTCTSVVYEISAAFAVCVNDSAELNSDLTPTQQAIAERFFTAAAQLREEE